MQDAVQAESNWGRGQAKGDGEMDLFKCKRAYSILEGEIWVREKFSSDLFLPQFLVGLQLVNILIAKSKLVFG